VTQLASVLAYALALEVVLHYIHFHALSHNLHKIFHVIDDGELWIPVWVCVCLSVSLYVVIIYLRYVYIYNI
jgi:hypothetical protein